MRTLTLALLAAALAAPSAVTAQPRDERHYPGGAFNWQFLERHPGAARLFNAFDYGHAVLYERLLRSHGAAGDDLEQREFAFLTTDLLRRPPRFGVPEEAIAPGYAKLAWRAKRMFEWAHVLHRQIYDAYADPRLAPGARDSLIEALTDTYLADRYAFTAVPKAMALMDEQPFSQDFRRRYPRFNGLIWSYHWLQVGLYDAFLAAADTAEARRNVELVRDRFWTLLEDPPAHLPTVMPMTAAVAPRFAARHPRAAVIFDNLHMMHDIISDILANPAVPPGAKGAEIARQLDLFQDARSNVITLDEWRQMGHHMGGVERMGGEAIPGGSASEGGEGERGEGAEHEHHHGGERRP